jgi:acetolactate synthase-1/2/3 large subunit
MIICGGAIKNSFAEKELKKLVEKLNLILATSVTGKGTLADTHPNCLGVVGSNGGSISTREVIKIIKSDFFITSRVEIEPPLLPTTPKQFG